MRQRVGQRQDLTSPSWARATSALNSGSGLREAAGGQGARPSWMVSRPWISGKMAPPGPLDPWAAYHQDGRQAWAGSSSPRVPSIASGGRVSTREWRSPPRPGH